MRPATNHTKESTRQRIQRDLEAWLSAGNRPQHIPSGVSGEQPLSKRKGRHGGRSIVISQSDRRVR